MQFSQTQHKPQLNTQLPKQSFGLVVKKGKIIRDCFVTHIRPFQTRPGTPRNVLVGRAGSAGVMSRYIAQSRNTYDKDET